MNANAIAIRGESMTGLHADPASVHEMLSALPGLSLTDDLDRLRSMLSELEQQPVKSATLVDCLERFAAPVALLEKQVRQQHIGLALPLSERERILTASLAAIFERIAAGFERALKPLIEEGREPAGFTPRHSSVALHGATHAIAEAFQCAWSTYQAPLPGLWRRLHRLHNFASSIGLTRKRDGSLSDLSRIYRRTVLLGLADPYALPFRALERVDEFLDTIVGEAGLHQSIPDADRRHLFMVDPGLDQAGIPLMRNDLLRDGTYVLDTTLLVRRVNKTQQDLSATFAHQSISRFSEMERLETLRTLAMHWRHRSLRSQRRKAEQELDLAVGLPVITTLLSDDKPLFDAFDVAASKLRGIFGSSQHAASASELRVSHWQVLDEGGGGLRLRCEDGGHDVRVGELVAWRARGSDHRWSVGVVRWARIGASNSLEVGVFTLGLNVEPLTVSAIREGDEPAEPVPALYFPGSSEPGQAATDTLVAASGLYSPGGQLWLKRSARSNIAAATKLRLSTRAFDWFEIDRQEATKIQGPRIPGSLAKLATSTAAVNKESRVSAPESLSDRRTVL